MVEGSSDQRDDGSHSSRIFGSLGEHGVCGALGVATLAEGEEMTTAQLLEGLKSNYHPSLHPNDQALKDMKRVLKTLNYGPVQTSNLYDELLKHCEYFPKVADIIANAKGICLPLTAKKPEMVWGSFEWNGKPYARRMGILQVEDEQARDKRMVSEAVSYDNGGKVWYHEAFIAAGGQYHGDYANVPALLVQPEPLALESGTVHEISDYDDSDFPVEVEFVDLASTLDDL